MKELEVKILEINRLQLEETLDSLGAKKVFDGDIQTILFDFEDGRILRERNVLRLRKYQDKAELTFKAVRVSETAKSAEEISVEVSSLEVTRQILENLGLSVVECMLKHRVSYTLDHVRFDIDCYSGNYGYIPEFLEIEGETVDSIHRNAALLGFQPEACLPWSTEELISHYSSKKTKR